MANEPTSKQNEMKWVKRSQIEVVEGFNARTGNWKTNEDPETEVKWSDFVASIKVDGIQTPLDVRTNPNHEHAKSQPYSLVAGFRRIAAYDECKSDALIPVVDHGAMSEKDARYRNGQENVARENLRTQDLAWLLFDAAKFEPGISQQTIANRFGLSQRYVGKLLGLMTKLQAKILQEWRGEKIKVTVNEVLAVSEEPAEKQLAAWERVLKRNADALVRQNAKGETEADATGNGKNKKWIVSGKKRANEIGLLLGTLAALECIEVQDDANWIEVVNHLTLIKGEPRGTKITKTDMKQVVNSLTTGINDGISKVEEEEQPEEEEEEIAAPVKVVKPKKAAAKKK